MSYITSTFGVVLAVFFVLIVVLALASVIVAKLREIRTSLDLRCPQPTTQVLSVQ